ncbi:class I SAM-dependent methyltransferase [Candidatus Liberibacter sp.]|uniref:class I SAM-dependent methyltransferase n=1 Tax=Candidatus Liberibacter sp. TaxID=34022 RepID=UPI0015F354D9|nr:methyltransferase domain-containing protein [Candidatus Liberibacter sp.]MBA5724011.1 methyltransferase domain-containing protein [Candidatus Liberibacter sp.]
MRVDIIELQQFYDSCLGNYAKDAISEVLTTVWDDVTGDRLLGLGYAIPFLECFSGKVERNLAFMPAGQGAISWTYQDLSATALVSEEELPLSDASINRVLVVHSLEFAEDPCLMLNEIWRVLSANGRVIIVIPNRCGMWARMEYTPFGCGQPYSCHQMISLLKEANFTVSGISRALFFPPTNKVFILRLWSLFEKIGRTFWPGFSGVYLIEARKILYQGLPVVESRTKRILPPVLVPTVSTRDNKSSSII